MIAAPPLGAELIDYFGSIAWAGVSGFGGSWQSQVVVLSGPIPMLLVVRIASLPNWAQ